MPEDKQMLSKQMGDLLKQITDPSIFTGANEAARLKFEADTADWGAKVHNSKQDFLNREIDKKTLAEHPEYQNAPNSEYIDQYGPMPLGSRQYNRLVPTPKFDYIPLVKASQVDGTKGLPDALRIGDVTNLPDGTQSFKLNPNGHYTEVTSGATQVDEKQIRDNFKRLTTDPVMFPTIKAHLNYVYQYETPPEKRKDFQTDGQIDYDKLLKPIEDYAVSSAKASEGKKDYKPSDFAKLAITEAGKNKRAAMHAANETEPPVTRDVFTGLYRAARYGEGGAKTTNVEGKEVGVNLSSLDLAKQNALLEIGRKSLGNEIGIKDLLLRYDPADGKLKLLDARKITSKTPKRKGWKIPSDAFIVDVNEVDVNLGANQTLGNKSQTQVVKEGQQGQQPQKIQRVIVDAEDF